MAALTWKYPRVARGQTKSSQRRRTRRQEGGSAAADGPIGARATTTGSPSAQPSSTGPAGQPKCSAARVIPPSLAADLLQVGVAGRP